MNSLSERSTFSNYSHVLTSLTGNETVENNEVVYWTDSMNQYQNYLTILSIATAPFIIPMIIILCFFIILRRIFTFRKIRRRKHKKQLETQLTNELSQIVLHYNKDQKIHQIHDTADLRSFLVNRSMKDLNMEDIKRVLEDPKMRVVKQKSSKLKHDERRKEDGLEMERIEDVLKVDNLETRLGSFLFEKKSEKPFLNKSPIHNDAYIHDNDNNEDDKSKVEREIND